MYDEDGGIGALKRHVQGIMRGDTAHDFAHVMRVFGNAKALCRAEGANERLVLASALLHDIASYPKSDPRSARSAERSAIEAKAILERHGFGGDEIEAVCGAIRDHSFSSGRVPGTAVGRILQDADRLDALGAIGIARVFATGGAMGRPLYDPEDPFCEKREPDDAAWTLDHFYRKLLRLECMMNTDAAKVEAGRRAAVLKEYLEQLGREIQP